MDEILKIVIQNLPLLYMPAVGALLALVLFRIKRRYVKEGYLFGGRSAPSRQRPAPVVEMADTSAVIQMEPESRMTTPTERTNAVIETRRFLESLASSEGLTDVSNFQEIAIRLLRHYPNDIDLSVSASAFPSVWSTPKA
jgi:hypothetical protein